MGPHPAVAAVRLAVRRALADVPSEVVVACSGGADSLALAAAVAHEAADRAVLVSVDHGLQPGSAPRALAVAGLALELGYAAAHVVPVDARGAGGPEAAARTARYAALDAFGRPVLLGHTLDDQAETVLLALGRGSGPTALRGMASGGRRIRPLLGLSRATTRAACEALGLAWWDDPHNADPRFTRARIRTEVLPLLEDVLGGGVAEALARTADQVREDAAALDALAAAALADATGPAPTVPVSADVATLAALPAAVRRRALRALLARAGAGPLTSVHLAAVDRLLTDWHGQGTVDLPGAFGVRRASGRLHVMPQRPPHPQG